MKTFITAAGLAVGASAVVLPRDQCCFQLTASGEVSGAVSQLSDGQNRVGGNAPNGQATYCINGDTLTDGSGRGCILTPPTTQLQCDKGATPDNGFSLNNNGMLQHNGDSTFYACAADNGEYNIYTETSDDQTKCMKITLGSDNGKCAGYGNGGYSSANQSPTAPATSAASSPAGYTSNQGSQTNTATAPGYTCPAPSTVTKTSYSTAAPVTQTSTVYSTAAPVTKTSTVYNTPAPVTQTSTVYKTVQNTNTPAPVTQTSTVYKTATATVTMQNTKTPAPNTDYNTVTQYKTQYKTQYETKYDTKYNTEYQTVSDCTTAPGQGYPTGGAPSNGYGTNTGPAPTSTVTATAPGSPSAGYPTKGGAQPSGMQPTGTAPGASNCPTSLVPGSYETPHLIVPVNSKSPDASYGTQYNAWANNANSTVFNFDIPQADEGKTCTLVFMLPERADLQTSDYTWNGKGSLDFSMLSGPATEDMSYNTCPAASQELGSVKPEAGGKYVVASGPCAAGQVETVEMSASGGMDLEFFEDYNPSPLGLFITVC